MLAALASVLLASCSTSDPDAAFGFAAAGPSPISTSALPSGDLAASSAASATDAEARAGEFVMDENDPGLPDNVAQMPTLRPGSAADASVQAAQDDRAEPQAQQAVAAAAPPPQPTAAEPASADASPVEQAAAPVEAQPAEQQVTAFAAEEPRKRGFLASLFAPQSARAAPAPQTARATAATTPARAQPSQAQDTQQTPVIQLASTGQSAKPIVARAAAGENALPGVRQNALFEISRRSGLDDDSDIDLHEGVESFQVASAAGLARLAPNGLMKQTDHVDVACLKPSLVRVLKTVERHYGRKVVVTSGYRSPERNRKARGARNSLHMYCAAADVQVEGVSKWDLAQFVRAMPGRGGVGTYCHTDSVHVDVGPERDWNWRCRRRK